MNDTVIDINGLIKRYNEKDILDRLSFCVRKDEILGILGPNGAGKTTTFNIITGLLKADKGEVIYNFNGNQCKSLKDRTIIGVVPQDICLYENMTVYENLKFFGKLYGVKKNNLKGIINELLTKVHLENKRFSPIHQLSGGMKRRINIACSLIHNPKLVIMDEPTVGIDPQSRCLIWDIIQEIKKEGKSIIITSHYVDEIERLSNRVLIMDHGKVIVEGTVEELIHNHFENSTVTLELNEFNSAIYTNINQIADVKSINEDEKKIQIEVHSKDRFIEILTHVLAIKDIDIKNIDFKKPSLEDVFFSVTGKGLRE